MSKKVIDVSSYQGKPDWGRVKSDGVVGAIIRIRNSKGVDTSWEHNYSGCGANGLVRGAYRYSYALSVTQAKAEAEEVIRTLDGRKLELGVYVDLEWSNQRALGPAKVKQIANAWMKVIRDAGYVCNVYCNLDWHRNVCGGLSAEYWVAKYGINDGVARAKDKPNVGEIGWQFTSKGRVAGISGNVDVSLWYGELDLVALANQKNPFKDSGKLLKYNPLTVRIVREDVKWLQWELREAGYQIQVDGKFGPKTDLALRAFQAAHPETYTGKNPDGICGTKTRAALKAA